jgi:hypothetical protein
VLLTEEPATTLTQFVRDEGTFVPDVTGVGITERPPMIEVEEYLRRYLTRRS